MSRSPARIAALFPFQLWLSREIQSGVGQYATKAGIPIHPLVFEHLFTIEQQEWVKGIIAFSSGAHAIGHLVQTGLPVVNVSGFLDSVPFPSVVNDSKEMGRLAARHMIDCGARKMGYVSVTATQTGFLTLRQEGVEEVCESAGIELTLCQPRIFRKHDLLKAQSTWGNAVQEWLKTCRPPIAIVAANPPTAEAVRIASEHLGWKLGEEVALIQLTGPEEERMLDGRKISYIPNDWRSVGRIAAESLHRWMEEGEKPAPLQLVPPLPLVLTSSSDPSRDASVVVRVRSFLKHSSDYGLTIDEIAANTGVSISTLYRQFRREAGHSLKQELLNRRLTHACDLLRTTELAIADIASRCGYSTGHSFAASFRQQYQLAPAAWRKQKRP